MVYKYFYWAEGTLLLLLLLFPLHAKKRKLTETKKLYYRITNSISWEKLLGYVVMYPRVVAGVIFETGKQ